MSERLTTEQTSFDTAFWHNVAAEAKERGLKGVRLPFKALDKALDHIDAQAEELTHLRRALDEARREREVLAAGFRAAVEVARERAGMGPVEGVFGYGSTVEQEEAASAAIALLSTPDRGGRIDGGE